MVGCKVEKTLLSKDNKIRGATIKHFKTVVLNRRINKLYPIEWMKQTIENIWPKFVDVKKICQIKTFFCQFKIFLYTLI